MTSGQDSTRLPDSPDASSLTETSPLLPKTAREPQQWGRGTVWKVLFTGFLVSLSFGVTQVPLIYVFFVMTCDEYYKDRRPGAAQGSCKLPEIEAGAAQGVALLGASTTLFGVMNLFITGWWIKKFGLKFSLVMSTFWPAVRLVVQNVGIKIGYGAGMIILQASQIITIIGGPMGYLLTLNSLAAEIVTPAERTGTLGRLQGCAMFGTALGFLSGGLLADKFSIIAPFRVTLGLFLVSTLYIWLCLPSVSINLSAEKEKKMGSISAFFEPLRMFKPQRWVLVDGSVKLESGILLLGIGVFMAVLATGYIPTLLQMYATDVFDFATTENGWLICIYSLLRGLFLTLLFPSIITWGRKWTDRRHPGTDKVSGDESGIPNIPTEPAEFEPGPVDGEQEPIEPPRPSFEEPESFHFDLIFTRYSILLDGILTAAATFTNKGWQLYLIAVILPFASGTGSSAKGTILQMCSPSQRTDALSAISLVESVARLSNIGLFGGVFSAFAAMGMPSLTFACNAGIAVLAAIVLFFARFPPPGSTRQERIESEV